MEPSLRHCVWTFCAIFYANVRHISSIRMHKLLLLFIINITSLLILLFISSFVFAYVFSSIHRKYLLPLLDATMCIGGAFESQITIAKMTTAAHIFYVHYVCFFFYFIFLSSLSSNEKFISLRFPSSRAYCALCVV